MKYTEKRNTKYFNSRDSEFLSLKPNLQKLA